MMVACNNTTAMLQTLLLRNTLYMGVIYSKINRHHLCICRDQHQTTSPLTGGLSLPISPAGSIQFILNITIRAMFITTYNLQIQTEDKAPFHNILFPSIHLLIVQVPTSQTLEASALVTEQPRLTPLKHHLTVRVGRWSAVQHT